MFRLTQVKKEKYGSLFTFVGEFLSPNKVIEELRIQFKKGLEPHHFLISEWSNEHYKYEMDWEINAHDWLHRLGITINLI